MQQQTNPWTNHEHCFDDRVAKSTQLEIHSTTAGIPTGIYVQGGTVVATATYVNNPAGLGAVTTLAVGETVILLASPLQRLLKREGVSAK